MNQGLAEIEQHLVSLIETNLRSQEISADRAQSIAKAAITHLKAEMSEYQLYQAAEALRGSFPELGGIAAEAEDQYEDKIREAVVRHACELLKQGNTEQASSLLTMAINKEQEIRIDG